MKSWVLILTLTLLLAATPMARAADQTIQRRPDNAEFVTETHVRLTTESLTIAEVTEATPSPSTPASFWEFLSQSFAAFIQAVRALFN